MPALGTTVNDLIDRARRDALMSSRGPVYTLGAAMNDTSAITLTLAETPSHIGGSGVGTILSVDYELMYVTAMNNSTKTATVIRGFYGTEPAIHAEGDLVEVDPRMPAGMLADFAQQEIYSWEKELFRVVQLDVDVVSTQRTFDLGYTESEDLYFLLDVRAEPTTTGDSWYNFSWTSDTWPHVDARLLRGMDAGSFASGYGLQLKHHSRRDTTLRVAVATGFDLDPFDGSLDLVATVGLKRQWLDIVELGMRARAYDTLITGRTNWRTGSVVRDAEEVTTFDLMRAADQARSRRDMRFTKAAVDLRGDWPFREMG